MNEEKLGIYSYSYGKYTPAGCTIMLLISILVVGMLCFTILSNDAPIEIVLIGLALFIVVLTVFFLSFFVREKLQIDYKNKQYRTALTFFSYIKSDKWKTLKNVQYLMLVNKNVSYTIRSMKTQMETATFSGQSIQLRFFIKIGYYIDIDFFDNKEKAIKIAKEIADYMHMAVFDKTVKPASFIHNEFYYETENN